MKLTKFEMHDAVRCGVKDALLEIWYANESRLTAYDAVSSGVYSAISAWISGCFGDDRELLDAIKKGVETAIARRRL